MTVCAVEGCGRTAIMSGFCKKHYWHYLTHGSPTAGRFQESTGGKRCCWAGCKKRAKTKGLCLVHYTRLWRYGKEALGTTDVLALVAFLRKAGKGWVK